MSVEDVTVLEGEWSAENPCIVIEVDAARKMLAQGAESVAELVEQGLAALELSGKAVVVLRDFEALS